jgi:nicotinate dehydrogenase subunit B
MNEPIFDDLLIEPERYELYTDEILSADLDRRDFFRIVGGGLIVACVLGEAAAQQPGRGRGGFGGGGTRELGARLHIGEDSVVTVYTGKVEIGQNIRTSLTQVVAEELHMPLERIRLVMADTQLCPDDGGTAGSASTPRTAPQLRRAAAVARELLLDLAAEKSKVDRASLNIKEGKIVSADGKTALAFGELTKGKKLMKVIDDKAATTPADKWVTTGTSPPKVDGKEFVTGVHRYASDVKRPGMLIGQVLRPPSFKAELVSLETKDAEALPGVTVVKDGSFVGVTATTEYAASMALATLRAEWKTTPQQPSSDELFDYLKNHPSAGRGGFGGRGMRDSRGSIADGLKAADRQVKATYTIAYIAHTPMEPRAAVAEWSGDQLTVWTGTQMPTRVRSELAGALKIPPEKVRVIVPDMGSGYGGKHSGEAAVEAARLAKAAGKPVKLVWTREEEFTWAYFRPAGVIDVTAAAKKDGTLTAWECHNYNSGSSSLRSPYESANVHTEFHTTESPLKQGSYRALAATANTFAREVHMDDLAHALGLDPLTFRLKNLKDARLRAVLEAAANRFGWGKSKPAADHGFGIACGTEKGSFVAACVEAEIERPSRRVKVLRVVTAFECGAILNPNHLTNQVEGATMMALGGALFESIRFANGGILNPHFADYRVPRFADVPRLETVLLDRKDLPSAGAGETPMIALAPAVGNAIFQATGVRLRSMPLAPKGVKAS